MKKLTFLNKLFYGVGNFGYSLNNSILTVLFPIFMTDVVGVMPGIAAIALFIGRSWDYINDPIVGNLSDRARTRWGRRRPFILFGLVPFAITFALLWWKPPLNNQIYLVAFYALAYILYDTSATIVYTPYFALSPDITSDYDERTKLTSFQMFFVILGSLVAYTLPMMVIKTTTPDSTGRMALMGIIFGVVAALPLLFVFFGTKERVEFSEEMDKPKFIASFKAALKNRPFVFAAVIYLFTWLSMNIVEANILFYLKYIVQKETLSSLLMGVMFITAIISIPLWEYFSRRFNKRNAYIYGVGFWAVVQILLITLSSSTPLYLIIFLCFLAGIGVGAAHVLPWSIIPDAVEWDEYHTGERHEGMFYSLVMLLAKIANSVAVPFSLMVLQLTGYIPNSTSQPQSALLGIRLVIGPVPAVLLIGGIIFAIFYPLSREKHQQIVKELEERRQARKNRRKQA